MPKNPGLKLFTKTWPKKRAEDQTEDISRPLTATLEKPTILNIKLMGLIDMSRVRKEFLDISNLCRIPLSIKTNRKIPTPNRPLSLPPQKKKIIENKTNSEENGKKTVKKISPIRRHCNSLASDANNNNKTVKSKIARKRIGNGKILEASNKNDLEKSTKLPEPCKTCGRPDQPERFHSHPATPLRPAKKMEKAPEKPPVKSSVQKPVAMKYKSKQTIPNSNKSSSPLARKPSLPSQKLVHTPPNKTAPSSTNNEKLKSPQPNSRVKSSKRALLTCYICGREFGTASLPLHEPKCLQKWEQENSNLPAHLRKKPPHKPDHPLTQNEWNKFAWESSQSTLTPCENCGRTFYPERLIVHQRSCKSSNSKLPVEFLTPTKSPVSPSTKPILPPSVECYICGRMFGTHSIQIHERQCLRKWHLENDALPEDMKAPPPVRNGDRGYRETTQLCRNKKIPDQPTPSSRKPQMFPCYICGRLYTLHCIHIHEPQCLKMWKIENDKLPEWKRRAPPQKPDVIYTRAGKIDLDALIEASWESHLSQLVPCKFCSRTFNPDRVQVHEKSCKG